MSAGAEQARRYNDRRGVIEPSDQAQTALWASQRPGSLPISAARPASNQNAAALSHRGKGSSATSAGKVSFIDDSEDSGPRRLDSTWPSPGAELGVELAECSRRVEQRHDPWLETDVARLGDRHAGDG